MSLRKHWAMMRHFTIVLVARAWLPHRLTAGSAIVQVMTAVRAHRAKCCKKHKDHIKKYLSGSRDSRPLDKEGIPKPDLADDQLAISKVRADACPPPAWPQHDQHTHPVHVRRLRCSAGCTVYVQSPNAN